MEAPNEFFENKGADALVQSLWIMHRHYFLWYSVIFLIQYLLVVGYVWSDMSHLGYTVVIGAYSIFMILIEFK